MTDLNNKKYLYNGIPMIKTAGTPIKIPWKSIVGGTALLGTVGAGSYLGAQHYVKKNLDKHIEKGARTFADSLMNTPTARALKQTAGTFIGALAGSQLGKLYGDSPTAGMLLGGSTGYGLGTYI